MKVFKRIGLAIALILLAGFLILSVAYLLWKPFDIEPLVLEVEQIEEGEERISFGSMQIDLPAGWKYEVRTTKEGQTQLVLIDAHAECEDEEIRQHDTLYYHEIVITAYEIKEMPDEPIDALVGMMEYFQYDRIQNYMVSDGIVQDNIWLGKIYNEEKQMGQFFLRSVNSREKRTELFEITEVYDYSNDNFIECFYDFAWSGCIGVYGGDIIIDKPDNTGEKIFLFEQKDDKPLVVSAQRNDSYETEVKVYDYYETNEPLTELLLEDRDLYYPDDWCVADLNQDGYEDFWGNLFMDVLHWEAYGYEGYVWNPQEQEFEIVSDEELFRQYLERNGKPVFVITEEDKIPQGLIDALSQGLMAGKQASFEVMAPMVSDRELTKEELRTLAKEHPAVQSQINATAGNTGCRATWLAVDADNDGLEDLFSCEFYGGTAGAVYYYLLKQEKDGSYTGHSVSIEMPEEFAFLAWEGKNYLAQTTVDFNRKMYDGIRLTSYKDGQIADEVWLEMVIADTEDAHHTEVAFVADEKYLDTLGEDIFDFAGGYEIDEYPQGTAETPLSNFKNQQEADIDNDGVVEQYEKTVCLPSNNYARAYLNFQFWNEGYVYFMEEVLSEEGVPLFLWVDDTRWGNVTFILSEDSLYDFHICAYLFTKEKCEMLMRVNHTFDLDINVHQVRLN